MWLICVLVALISSILLHAFAVRIFSSANRPVAFLIVGSAVGLGMLAVVASEYGFASPQFAAAVTTYAFCSELYLFLFSSVLTSISMNLLVKLCQKPLSDAEIAHIYDSRRMVEARIERLVASGLLKARENNRHEVTTRGLRLLTTLGELERFFRNTPARDA